MNKRREREAYAIPDLPIEAANVGVSGTKEVNSNSSPTQNSISLSEDIKCVE